MKLKYSTIDVNSSTPEEINKEIKRLEKLKTQHNDTQMALKIFMNSVYGAFSNRYFICYNRDSAEAITLQGQHILKYSDRMMNEYFKKDFLNDVELHEKLGVKIINPNFYKNTDLITYCDTDSNHLNFDAVIKATDYQGEPLKFILNLYKYKLKDYIVHMLNSYGNEFKTPNLMDFELEAVYRSAIFLGKKKYVMDAEWKMSGVTYKQVEKITFKGVEIVRTDTPHYARQILKDFVKDFLIEGNNLDINKVIKRLKNIRNEFIMQDIEDVSFGSGLNDYPKYVVNDRDKLVLKSATPIHIRAAATYNFILNQNKKLKNKYQLIKSRDKIKWYYSQGGKVFGFPVGVFPNEFSLEIDYIEMFNKSIISPLNRFTQVMISKEIPTNLMTIKSLF